MLDLPAPRRRLLTLLLGLALVVPVLAAGAPQAPEIRIDLQRQVLDNGLEVLVWERPAAGRVGARVFYQVDIAAERPGSVGLAHMLEHYLFKGSRYVGTSDWEAERPWAIRVEELERLITDAKNAARDCFRQRAVEPELEMECTTPELEALRGEYEAAVAQQDRYTDGIDLMRIYQFAGGTGLTASTGPDWMKFDIDLPANKLELFMWIERSRLEWPVFRQFEQEREVVTDQIRRGDNTPSGKFERVLGSMSYDAHPYGWAHWFSDLTRATREDHWEIFYKYFIPQNTVIVVVGDVQAQEVFELAEQYWGDWAPGRPSPRLRTVEPAPVGQKRLVVEAPAGPTLVLNVPMPAVGHDDAPVFQVLAGVLGGPDGLLAEELVRDGGPATSAQAGGGLRKYPGIFSIRANGRSSEDLPAIEAGIDVVLQEVAAGNVDAARIEGAAAALVFDMAQGLGSIGSSAVRIGMMAAIHEPDYLERLPGLWRSVTGEDLARVVRQYFGTERRVIGELHRVVADGDLSAVAPAGESTVDVVAGEPGLHGLLEEWGWTFSTGGNGPALTPAAVAPHDAFSGVTASEVRETVVPAAPVRTAQVEPSQVEIGAPLGVAENPWYTAPWIASRRPTSWGTPAPVEHYADLDFAPAPFAPPSLDEGRVRLDNGMSAWIREDPLLPVVRLTAYIDAPTTQDPRGKEGLAALVAEALTGAGAADMSASDLQGRLRDLGASLSVTAGASRTHLTAIAPAASATALLEIVGDVLLEPRFEPDRVASLRERAAVRADRELDNAGTLAQHMFDRQVYGEAHPLGARSTGTSVRAIGDSDLRDFHDRHYRPERIALAVSGAFERASVERSFTDRFGPAAAVGESPGRVALPDPDAPTGRTLITADRPTRQAHVILGHLGISADLPEDHAALELMNYTLCGGGFVSRMMELLRVKTGISSAPTCELEPMRGGRGTYLWRFSGNPDTLARGVRLALEEIATMRADGISEQDLDRARTAYLEGLIPASYDTAQAVMERLAHRSLLGIYEYQSPQYLNFYAGDSGQMSALERVTLEDANAAARRYLDPDNLVIAIVGPMDRILASASDQDRALLESLMER